MKTPSQSPESSPSHQTGIAIIAPSGCPIDDAAYLAGITTLEQQGFIVDNYFQPEQKFQRFAADDAQRLSQFYAAACNPEIKYVMALRGGYGLSRLLPQFDFYQLADSGKRFIGHSDFTAFHMALYARTGTSSIAGPMLCDDFSRCDVSEFTLQHFHAALREQSPSIQFAAMHSPHIAVEGILWGGNLAMVTHLLATDYFPKIEHGILFLEDIAEHPYRVERMLLQLHYAGVLEQQRAIVLGDFSAYKLGPNDNGYNFDEMLKYVRSVIRVPILTGLPFGHIKDKVSLLFGCRAQLSCDGDSAILKMNT